MNLHLVFWAQITFFLPCSSNSLHHFGLNLLFSTAVGCIAVKIWSRHSCSSNDTGDLLAPSGATIRSKVRLVFWWISGIVYLQSSSGSVVVVGFLLHSHCERLKHLLVDSSCVVCSVFTFNIFTFKWIFMTKLNTDHSPGLIHFSTNLQCCGEWQLKTVIFSTVSADKSCSRTLQQTVSLKPWSSGRLHNDLPCCRFICFHMLQAYRRHIF